LTGARVIEHHWLFLDGFVHRTFTFELPDAFVQVILSIQIIERPAIDKKPKEREQTTKMLTKGGRYRSERDASRA
jgi:hypothetical protein